MSADLTFADYRALDAWGSGSLKAMRRGPPARVQWERSRPNSNTDATILGSAVHCALLTPHLFTEQYAVKPDGMSFASKEGKAWRDDPVRAGRVLISHDTGAQVDAIVNALLDKPAVQASIKSATAFETSIAWQDPATGEACKARPDWIEGDWIYDLKVSRYASDRSISYRAFADGWMHQSAHYRSGANEVGIRVTGGRLVVVDPTAPHFVYTLEIKPDSLDLLALENIETLKRLRECRLSGIWPGTDERWLRIEPPAGAPMDTVDEGEEI